MPDIQEQEPKQEPEEKFDLRKTAARIIKFPLYFLGFVLLGLLFAYLTFKLMSFSRTVDVPDLIGKTALEANELLTKKGLNLRIEGEDYDLNVSAGCVVRQDIPAGSEVKERRIIKVVLSKGPKVQSVPFVVGEYINKAESILLQKGLKTRKIIRVHSNSVEKDKVIAQKPGPDEISTEKITLVASLGQYEMVYYCPNFLGKTHDEALQLAKKLSLKLKAEGQEGVVKVQRPQPGSVIKPGDTIDIKLEAEEVKIEVWGGRIE